MSAEQALFDAYRDWRRLTIAAGRAIQQRNWSFLRDCQEFTRKLPPLITRLTGEARAEWERNGDDRQGKEQAFQPLVAELIDLLQQNQALIQTAKRVAMPERNRLEQAGQNLRLLQQSYAFARPAGWSSIS